MASELGRAGRMGLGYTGCRTDSVDRSSIHSQYSRRRAHWAVEAGAVEPRMGWATAGADLGLEDSWQNIQSIWFPAQMGCPCQLDSRISRWKTICLAALLCSSSSRSSRRVQCSPEERINGVDLIDRRAWTVPNCSTAEALSTLSLSLSRHGKGTPMAGLAGWLWPWRADMRTCG